MKAYQLSEGDQIMLHGHLWTVDKKRVTRKNKVELWVHRGQRSIKMPLLALEEEVPVPRRADEALQFDETPRPHHVHEWTTLWKNLGENMRQDVHAHACTDEQCYHLLVGEGRECNGVLTNHAHEHASNMAAYSIRPPRGDTRKEEEVEGTEWRSKKREVVMPRVVEFLITKPNQEVTLNDIVQGTGLSIDQVRRVMSNLKAPSRDIQFGKYIEVLAAGRVWAYRPRAGADSALRLVRGVETDQVQVPEAAKPPPGPPLPNKPGDQLPPNPRPGPSGPPTPRQMAEDLAAQPSQGVQAVEEARAERETDLARRAHTVDERWRVGDSLLADVWTRVGVDGEGNPILRSPEGVLGRWAPL